MEITGKVDTLRTNKGNLFTVLHEPNLHRYCAVGPDYGGTVVPLMGTVVRAFSGRADREEAKVELKRELEEMGY